VRNLLSAILFSASLAVAVAVAVPAGAAAPTKALHEALPGLTWDSIRRLPDWSGMWTPARAPAGATSLGSPGGMFGQGAPLSPKYAEIRDKRMILVRGEGPGGTGDIPLSNSGMCLPNGTPHNMEPVSHEYLYSPGRVTLLLENSEVRRIWTDGRGHVPDELSNPSYSGDSIGRWEGETLVVDTVNIFPEAELFIGQHVSEKTRVKERITRVGNMLRIDTVVEDPEIFSKPWTYTRWYSREVRDPVDYNACTAGDRAKKDDGRLQGIDFNPNKPKPESKP
jgi:hypothetical protein